MRFLFAAHNVYTGHTSGAARRRRVLMEWLAAAGHDCEVLATGRFDTAQSVDIEDHLAQLDVPLTRTSASTRFTRSVQKARNVLVGRPTVRFSLGGVPVTMLLTAHNDMHERYPIELQQFSFLFDEVLRRFSPDVLLT